MKKTQFLRGGEIYAAPTIEILDVAVEAGFAATGVDVDEFGYDDDPFAM